MNNNQLQVKRTGYSVREVAESINCSESTVRKLIRTGELPSKRVGPKRIVVPVWALEKYLNEL
ncbi:hypothetical protein SYNTR_0701 [Candidatus Syntrophocurvum alkaliphilum]|uniref:Helix-turn-helix domain-containing protein n=1 Tax=Candidatus Syntrophocurvum alkaliphilum TaxID=2293317 RepID=A0A6I6DF73_9FIRM|nr:helix-turn-helix domain-containing protein [Candidatus Syntrophocurvum alkaliphilum]QGT99294.1 hypothetical protein SYNTR_0701 [Candidatus Syntrophocurvum alkaliphilum]